MLVMQDGSTIELTPEASRRVVVALSDDPLLSPNEAAELLGVSRPMVVRWLREGVLPDHPVGSHHKLPLDAVLEFKAARSKAGTDAVRLAAAADSDPAAARRVALARAAALAQIAARDA